MKKQGLVWTVAGLLLVATMTSGCMRSLGYVRTSKHNEALDRLQNMMVENETLRSQNSAFGNENGQLRNQNDELNMQLRNYGQRMGSLEEQLKDAEARASASGAELEGIRRKFGILAGNDPANFELTAEGALVVRVPFDLGSADVKPAGKTALASAAEVLKSVPPSYLIYIDGHTDDLPVKQPKTKEKFVDNWGLGASRALAVLRTLASQGIPDDQMIARSFGERKPLVSGRTAEARRKNRRVEISVVPASNYVSMAAPE